MALNKLQELIAKIKQEDHTYYLELLSNISNIKQHEARKILDDTSQEDVDKLTENQLLLLRTMEMRGGYTIWTSNYSAGAECPFTLAFNKYNRQFYASSFITTIAKEDLFLFSPYLQTKWRKAHPSARAQKGTELNFTMDMFSLMAFKNGIKKPFLRTQAKNYIMKVNEAINQISVTDATIKIRNKFYAVILDNTEVHTKALLNMLHTINLRPNGTEYYLPDEDEALSINLRLNTSLIAYNTPDSHNTYSSDLTLVTHNNGIEGYRENNRLAAAASMLLTAYSATSHEPFKVLAKRTLQHLDTNTTEEILNKTNAIAELRTIIKPKETK